MQRLRTIALFLFLPLCACSGADLVNSLVPKEGYRSVTGLPYGTGPRQSYDLYLPEGAEGALPTVIFFYGGGWDSGAKEDYLFAAQAFASRGYAVAVPDYRLYPEIRYPAFLEDAAAAVAKIARDPGVPGIAVGPIYLVGHSAGAYNVAMLTLDRRWLDAAGLSRCAIAASVGLAGPYDFLPLESETLKAVFRPQHTGRETQPIEYADATAPPLLLISGLEDTTVLPANSERLAARIRELGGAAELKLYEDIDHIELVGSLADPLRGWASTLDDVDDFLRRHPGTADEAENCRSGAG